MRLRIPTQLALFLAIIVIGVGLLGGEFVLVKWYPQHRQNVIDAIRNPLPYRNDALGIEMDVPAGIYGKVTDTPDGVRIFRPKLIGQGPSLTITEQPNPDGSTDFSDQLLAQWETRGATHGILGYRYDYGPINGRNAALIWEPKINQTVLTAHLISPKHILQVNCVPGVEDQEIFLAACKSAVRSIKLDGGAQAQPAEPTIYELAPKGLRMKK